MQWLIDIVKEWIEAQGYLKTSYVHRPDFVGEWLGLIAEFNTNEIFTVDFSPVVPAGAKAVVFRLRAENSVAGLSVFGNKHGEEMGPGHCIFNVGPANIIARSILVLGCDEDRKIDLNASAGGLWANVAINPRGWIL